MVPLDNKLRCGLELSGGRLGDDEVPPAHVRQPPEPPAPALGFGAHQAFEPHALLNGLEAPHRQQQLSGRKRVDGLTRAIDEHGPGADQVAELGHPTSGGKGGKEGSFAAATSRSSAF